MTGVTAGGARRLPQRPPVFILSRIKSSALLLVSLRGFGAGGGGRPPREQAAR
jgi:hypothetical protein